MFVTCTLAACAAPVAPVTPVTPVAAPHVAEGHALPVELASDRWFLVATTASGEPLRIYLDSAGGMFLTKATAARLALAVETETTEDGKGDVVVFPALADAKVPRSYGDRIPLFDPGDADVADGMFGAPWFRGHAFTFDYPNKRLILRDAPLPAVAPEHRVVVHFPVDDKGAPTSAYGRIEMTVDGAAIDMLLDTGATTTLTDEARTALGGDARARATSFITKTIFDRWHAAHPEWRVIEHADQVGKGDTMPMIEVPIVRVGGYDVGPVWFTWRPDKAFHEWMAQWMDKPTEGALGGDAFHTLRVSVDWATGAATFERQL
jgi:hypothetical protein